MAVSLVSASKTFNLAGLQQAALLCMDKTLMETLRKTLCENGVVCGNLFALEATRAAYTQCDDWLDGLLSYLDAGRAIVRDTLAQTLPHAALTPIEATYLAWLDLRAYAPDTKTQMARLKAGGVLLTPGTFFGEDAGDGFVRLNFGCPHDMLREGLARMARALNG